jgi:prepilin-type N-terminal cleavage/methylation domain-containing protein
MRLLPHLHREDGFSLAELLITIVLVSVTFVAILTGLMTTIRVSAAHRTQATTDAVARSAAEWVKDSQRNPYRTACSGTGMYTTAGLAIPTGYSAAITRVEYWDGSAPAASGTYDLSSHIQSSCPGGSDKGLQRITIVASSSNGQATETIQILKRAIT